MKNDITSRVIRQRREVKRIFQSIRNRFEDLNVKKSADQLADECYERGVYEIDKDLRHGKKD
jgi:hypothetical protein